MNNNIKKITRKFLKYIDQELHYSKNTVIGYEYDLNTFMEFLKNYNSEFLIKYDNIDRIVIRHYLGREFELGRSSKTVARRLASIKSFFKYLVNVDLLKINPSEHVKSPKIEKHIPSFIQENKIEQLMNLPDNNTIKGSRDHAILELFYATGIRLSELVGLNIESVNYEERIIKVVGKGKKERIVPFGKKAASAIEYYLQKRGHSWMTEPKTPLFIGNKGNRISIRTVQYRISKYLQVVLGGKNGASPHTLRHTFGTHLLDNNADIRSIQELLGHSSISSTQIYTKVNPQKIKEKYKEAHPHAT